MSNRREFLKYTGAAALGTFALGKQAQAFFSNTESPVSLHPIGLQLFTFFPIIDQDVPGTLKKIAAIGYKEIESAFSMKGGYYGMKPKEFAKLVKDSGMSWQSHHVLGAPFKMPANAKPMLDAKGQPIKFPPMHNLKENRQQLVDEAAEGGFPYLVCANIPTHTMDEVKSSIDILNNTGEACKKAGITLCYHNHTEEFEKLGTATAYEMFLKDLHPDIEMELDLCWATKAGIDPVALFKAHPGRFPLWHVKDLDQKREGPAPVGTGVVDFKRIFANAATAGMKHFFVEHDMPKDAYASIRTSYNNLTKILSA
ncbi:MAG TPA: sugar phosphate isomerase/epimerase [Puia sp.]|uniref:sugar phosphate isomerase/epimerase family protein n=1 Tax=Puia sp. TaxID=2045100 RepID=UPI002C2DF1AD|nr:sugar phosphate isomerase/epimerase [Puia sp.]HVU94529.1 sugar phosphate isomerase/epimerase [Puia sp.]